MSHISRRALLMDMQVPELALLSYRRSERLCIQLHALIKRAVRSPSIGRRYALQNEHPSHAHFEQSPPLRGLQWPLHSVEQGGGVVVVSKSGGRSNADDWGMYTSSYPATLTWTFRTFTS